MRRCMRGELLAWRFGAGDNKERVRFLPPTLIQMRWRILTMGSLISLKRCKNLETEERFVSKR